jgi:hypothetical protein
LTHVSFELMILSPTPLIHVPFPCYHFLLVPSLKLKNAYKDTFNVIWSRNMKSQREHVLLSEMQGWCW